MIEHQDFFSKVLRAYRLFGLKHAVQVVQELRPDLTYDQAYDLARDIIFEFVS